MSEQARWVIVGAGFAGAATAWALSRMGLGPGVILEQEPSFGVHASGRNAALVKLSESDPVIRALARRGLSGIRSLESPGPIGEERLEAVPYATLCIEDKRALERTG
jgi:glycine/D-amino acid oxidase-like deaminating enzyme